MEGARLDPAIPSAARIYDYLLGGKDNFAVDRDAADRLLAVVPDQRRLARANRTFALRAVRFLAGQGVRQVIDLGTGMPTTPSVHECRDEIEGLFGGFEVLPPGVVDVDHWRPDQPAQPTRLKISGVSAARRSGSRRPRRWK